MAGYKKIFRKIWFFLWEDDSFLSWMANLLIAFVLVKFVIYPGLGLMLGTVYPVVAVVSSSMEHTADFDQWWDQNKAFYEDRGMTREDFRDFDNGFNKGDMMILLGKNIGEINKGDVIVYSVSGYGNPVIHRVVSADGKNLETKGDNNSGQLSFEHAIGEDQLLGKAVLRVPWLGWAKVWFSSFIDMWR